MGRVKHQESEEAPETEATTPERSYHELVANVNAIARPLASRKLTRKLYKCVKKAAKLKQIRRGVKEVQKFINKGEKGSGETKVSYILSKLETYFCVIANHSSCRRYIAY